MYYIFSQIIIFNKGLVANDEVMLDEFYGSMGWDLKTGLPTTDTLSRLKLE